MNCLECGQSFHRDYDSQYTARANGFCGIECRSDYVNGSRYTRCDHDGCGRQRTIELLAHRADSNIIDRYKVCQEHLVAHMRVLTHIAGVAYSDIEQNWLVAA